MELHFIVWGAIATACAILILGIYSLSKRAKATPSELTLLLRMERIEAMHKELDDYNAQMVQLEKDNRDNVERMKGASSPEAKERFLKVIFTNTSDLVLLINKKQDLLKELESWDN